MTLIVQDNDGTNIATSGTTVNPIYETAPNGRSYIQIFIHEDVPGNLPVAISGGTLTANPDDAFYIRSPQFTELDTDGTQSLGDMKTVVIVFEPTSTGTKTGTFTITIGGTLYTVSLSGVCAAADAAIMLTGGLTPNYGTATNREAPCVIMAHFDPDNTHLPAPFVDCYFKWTVTPPNAETFVIADPRTIADPDRDIFQHYQGNAIAIPVLATVGSSDVWTLDLDIYTPDPDPDVKVPVIISATQVSVTVDQERSANEKIATSAGRGTKDGSSLANAWGDTELRANIADDDHVKLYSDDGNFDNTATWSFGNLENVSIEKHSASAGTPTFRKTTTGTETILIGSTKGTWFANIDFDPAQAGGVDATRLQNPENMGLYKVNFGGDGAIADVFQGNYFNDIFNLGVDTGFPTAMTQFPRGLGIMQCTGTETDTYSYIGGAVCLVEVGCTFKGSKSQTVSRSLVTPGTPTGTFGSPFGDIGFWFYNSLLTIHDTSNILTARPCWRFMGSMFINLNQCMSQGQTTMANGPNTGNGNLPLCFDISYQQSYFDFNFDDLNMMTVSSGIVSGSLIGNYFRKIQDTAGVFTQFMETVNIVNCTFHNTGHVGTSFTVHNDGGADGWWGTDKTENRLSAQWHSNITISTFNTNAQWWDDVLITNAAHPLRATNCITNNVFPATNDNNYDVKNVTYATPALLDAIDQASNTNEVDITLDAAGRPNETTSVNEGRDSRQFFDYHLKENGVSDDWAGMTQEAAVSNGIVRLGLRVLP